MIPVNRRKALFLGVDALAGLVAAKVASNRPRTGVAAGSVATALPETAAAGVTYAATVTLNDDFTNLGTREIIGKTIKDSVGTSYTWTQLLPSPAWRRGPFFSTGNPGIVNGKLIRRDPTSAMYPGLVLPDVPSHWEVDFFLDPNGTGGRSVFIHLFADTDGTKDTSEIPLHVVIGQQSFGVKAVSTVAGETVLTGFGNAPATNIRYDNNGALQLGVRYTVKFDVVGDTVTITFPAATNTTPKSYTDSRLRTARHPGGGPGVFLVLEDEADLASEPYNGFYAVRIVLGSSGGGGGAPTITSVVPAARGQGAKNLPVTVTGTGFATGAVASFSGTGVSIVSQTRVSTTEIQLQVSVAATAAVGARTLTVKNPDASNATATFTVTPKPQPTSASPAVSRGTTQTVTITGTNFVAGPGLKVQIAGTGITEGAATWVSATTITVPVKVASGVAATTYKVTVLNPDGGQGSKANCFTVS